MLSVFRIVVLITLRSLRANLSAHEDHSLIYHFVIHDIVNYHKSTDHLVKGLFAFIQVILLCSHTIQYHWKSLLQPLVLILKKHLP